MASIPVLSVAPQNRHVPIDDPNFWLVILPEIVRGQTYNIHQLLIIYRILIIYLFTNRRRTNKIRIKSFHRYWIWNFRKKSENKMKSRSPASDFSLNRHENNLIFCEAFCDQDLKKTWILNRIDSLFDPSLNSTIALSVFESASAITQNNLMRPQPSCRSTLIASSSSLNTWISRQKHFRYIIID